MLASLQQCISFLLFIIPWKRCTSSISLDDKKLCLVHYSLGRIEFGLFFIMNWKSWWCIVLHFILLLVRTIDMMKYNFTLDIFAEDSIFVGNTHFSLKSFFLFNRKLKLVSVVHVSIRANMSLFKNRKHLEKSLLTLKEDYNFKSSWPSKSILFK